jgi:hypothetical protein
MNNIYYALLLVLISTISACGNENFSENPSDSKEQIVDSTKIQYILVSHETADEEMFITVSQKLKNQSTSSVMTGVSLFLCYLQKPIGQVRDQLEKFLNLADKYNLPVMIQFDGIDYQNAYPEVWNWWDPSQPGYNPANVNNVEWTSWTPDSAVKLGWRNWGSQHRVGPMPNLASPAYRALCFKQLSVLVPIVLNWWKEPGRKHQLVGIQMDNEVSIGANNYFLPDGNSYLIKPKEEDPQLKLNHTVWPGFGAQAIGFAAVKTQGLANSGILKEEDVARVTDKYVYDLCQLSNKLGVPRNMLFTHVGGWNYGQLIFYSALNEYSCPGWSFYHYAADPALDITAMDALKKSDAPYWCNAETFHFGGTTEQAWVTCLKNNLKISRVRYVNIRNWRGMKDKNYIFEAIKRIQL